MFDRLLKSFTLGLQRRWYAGLMHALSVAGAIWLATEILTRSVPAINVWVDAHGDIYLWTVIAFCVVWFLYKIYETRCLSFCVPTTTTKIELRFGDLLKEPTDWLIGAGEFFDSKIGSQVSPNSLHGKVISSVFNGDQHRFRAAVDKELEAHIYMSTSRPLEPSRSYPIGTTIKLPNGAHNVFLVAMARTSLDADSKATSNVPLLWEALNGAFEAIRKHGNGATVSLPLMGNGQSGINIQPQHLLRLIVLAIVDFGRRVGLPKQVNIILPDACFEELDIREIQRDWQKR